MFLSTQTPTEPLLNYVVCCADKEECFFHYKSKFWSHETVILRTFLLWRLEILSIYSNFVSMTYKPGLSACVLPHVAIVNLTYGEDYS